MGGDDTGVVLVVDDEDVVLEVASEMLEMLGLDSVRASSGVHGIARFSERPDRFSLVLLDMTMPGLDGEETMRELRRIRADIPVILSSGYSEEDALAALGVASEVAFLQKPYTMAELSVCARQALRRSGRKRSFGVRSTD